MQQRRGNRVDLPQPLRPGEIGLASDSKEIFIGLDPTIGIAKQNANAININNVVSGYTYANGYLNNNVVRIILPSKRLAPSVSVWFPVFAFVSDEIINSFDSKFAEVLVELVVNNVPFLVTVKSTL